LSSTDGYLRDRLVYSTLAFWIERGEYSDEEVRAITEQMLINLKKGVGRDEDDSVFLRTFSALILASVLDWDGEHHFLRLDEANAILRDALTYFADEKDWRAFVPPEKGWAHSVAHTADLFECLARSAHTDSEGLWQILDAIGAKVKTPNRYSFVAEEDERLAVAVQSILRRNLLDVDQVCDWVHRVAQAPAGTTWRELTYREPKADEDGARAYHNTKAFLRAMYLQLKAYPAPGYEKVIPAIELALREQSIYMYRSLERRYGKQAE
jgi:hypothetical protein